jgi:hypothetical protein
MSNASVQFHLIRAMYVNMLSRNIVEKKEKILMYDSNYKNSRACVL